MSAAAAAVDAAGAPKKGGKKKLLMILAVVGVLVLGGGGAALFMIKQKAAAAAAAAEEAEDGAGAAHATPKSKAKSDDKHGPPIFLPLDVFTVNLADRQADRYAQIGITLEIDDAKTGDQIKAYMPAIRNNILMVLAHKTAEQLTAREGKQKLTKEVLRESLKPMGIEVEDEEQGASDEAHDKPGKDGKKRKKKKVEPDYPIRAVHFSSFIIQ